MQVWVTWLWVTIRIRPTIYLLVKESPVLKEEAAVYGKGEGVGVGACWHH
jgi:hypothetical protein